MKTILFLLFCCILLLKYYLNMFFFQTDEKINIFQKRFFNNIFFLLQIHNKIYKYLVNIYYLIYVNI